VMETHLGGGMEDIDRLFMELETNGFIHRSTLQKRLDENRRASASATEPAPRDSSVLSHDLDVVFDKLDLGGTGVISLTEFRAAALAQRQQMLQTLLKPVFMHLDLDKTGQISPSEMVKVFAQLGVADVTEQQVAEMMRHYDTSKTGSLNFTEFRNMIMSVRG